MTEDNGIKYDLENISQDVISTLSPIVARAHLVLPVERKNWDSITSGELVVFTVEGRSISDVSDTVHNLPFLLADRKITIAGYIGNSRMQELFDKYYPAKR